MVVNGAGAAAIACTNMLVSLGLRRENIIMCDSKGVISSSRTDLNTQKKAYARDVPYHTLAEAIRGADVFLGLSVKGALTTPMLKSMAYKPIVFALANPDPEIDRDEAYATRQDIIFATGRSDLPNQINNLLGFPYIFRGALDTRATCINEEMKQAAVYAIAELAHEPVPQKIKEIYGGRNMAFGPDYLLPTPFDSRLLTHVAPAVARAATDSGVARTPLTDAADYARKLTAMMHHENEIFHCVTSNRHNCAVVAEPAEA